LAPQALGHWYHHGINFPRNPTGSFTEGGPSVDCGLTERKIIMDTYGGAASVGFAKKLWPSHFEFLFPR
jgi:S-adenosylmethionine synthetase